MSELGPLLRRALAIDDDDGPLRAALIAGSGLPGPRLNLRLVWSFARTVGELVAPAPSEAPDPDAVDPDAVDALDALLDGWAALDVAAAPGDRPEVVLPCSAVAAYGEVGAIRPDWWRDEVAKLRRAAGDDRWRVREVVAAALQRLLDADWDRTVSEVLQWTDDEDPLVVRAAAAAVAEPPQLAGRPSRAASAAGVQRRAVEALRRRPGDARRTPPVRVLRQALGFTVGVVVAATGDFGPLRDMAASGDPDLRWAVRENLKKSRLRRWPDESDAVRALLDGLDG